MSRDIAIGVIGCGNISAAYFSLAPLFRGIAIVACADIDRRAAEARAAEFGVAALSVDDLLADEAVELVLNLTVPSVHYAVSRRALEAGKHVYSEKPFVLSVEEGRALAGIAGNAGLRVGSAPDTFLGGAPQLARHLVDDGAIGTVSGGTCHVMSAGMENWHPNPDFFFKPGAGPILDLGPYYIANLVQLIGPIKRVGAMTSIPRTERTITSMPRHGAVIRVETPTTIHALLEFETGAIVTLGASWDVAAHTHPPMELYGGEGSLLLPDPNFFGGEVRWLGAGGKPLDLPAWPHPFGRPNHDDDGVLLANYRAAGLADMAQAILEDRPHRCSPGFALHVVDVMTAILESGEGGSFIDLSTRCDRPAALSIGDAAAMLR